MKNFVLLLIALMLFIFMLTGCAQKGITAEEFDKEPLKILEESIDYQQLLGIDNDFVKAINGKNAKISDSSKITFGIDLGGIMEDDSFPALDLTVAQANGSTDIDLDVAVGGFTADARLYIDGDVVAVESDAFLGGAYSVKVENLSTFIEKFDKSELAKALSLPRGTAAAVCEQYGINDEYIAGIKYQWEKMSSIASLDLTKRIKQVAQPRFTPAQEETVDINGVQTEVITSTSSVTREMYADIMGEYFDISEELTLAVTEFINALLPEALKEQTGIDTDMGIDGFTEQYNSSVQDMMGAIAMEGNVKYYLEKATGKLLKMDYSYDYQIEGIPAKYLLTADLTDGFKLNGTLTADGQTIDMNMDIVHTYKENSDSWVMNITQGSPHGQPEFVQMALTLDKSEGTYRLTVNAEGEETALTGTYKCEKDTFELTLDTLETMDERVELGITFGYSENIEITPPSHKELLTLTQQEAYALVGKISSFALSMYTPAPQYEYDSYYDDYSYITDAQETQYMTAPYEG